MRFLFQIIIVGAGIGGLSCAIECRLQGHEVLVFEQAAEFKAYGESRLLFLLAGYWKEPIPW